MKPHKISTHLAYSDNCYFHVFYRLSDWVEILQGFTKFNFKRNLKVSAFYLEKQKSFIPKKNIFLVVVNIKTKKLCLLTQFPGRFWCTVEKFKFSQILLGDKNATYLCSKNISTLIRLQEPISLFSVHMTLLKFSCKNFEVVHNIATFGQWLTFLNENSK